MVCFVGIDQGYDRGQRWCESGPELINGAGPVPVQMWPRVSWRLWAGSSMELVQIWPTFGPNDYKIILIRSGAGPVPAQM